LFSKGVVAAYLAAGATVAVVSRTAAKVAELKKSIASKNINTDKLVPVVGEFKDEANAKAALSSTLSALHNKLDHVISNLGFANLPRGGPTASKLADLHASFEEGLYNTFLAAQVFLPVLKANAAGGSYTISSGGLAHAAYSPTDWAAGIKNAAVNRLGLGLAKEYEGTAVRVNVVCIHIGVADFDGTKNQFGMDAADTRLIAPAYLNLASSDKRGLIKCVNNAEEAKSL
jgi:NAD(P)-dependent dehydrogenase (short-subunit alcohol dehydrogenase family)